MTFSPAAPGLTLGIVGTGVMGRGIAQIAAASGCRVLLYDANPQAAEGAKGHVADMLRKLAEKGRMTAADAEAAVAAITPVSGLAAFAEAQVVVEAIVEDIEVKRRLIAQLDAIVGDNAVLASNTSSLAVTSIAAGSKSPQRVAGFHFFNPVPLMKIVEVIGGPLTDPAVTEALVGLARRFGHRPVVVKDSPGFLVNHAGRGYGTEALRLLSEGVAAPAAVDRVLREAAGFRMGPFELLDLTGLDVSHPVMESIYHQFYEEPRFRPSPETRLRLSAGLLGRKAGAGFYRYDGDKKQEAPAAPVPALPATLPDVWIGPGPEAARAKIAALVTGAGARLIERDEDAGLCLVLPLGKDATTTAVELGIDANRTVAVDCLFGLDSHRTLMTTPITDPKLRDAAHALLAADGTPATVIADSPGFLCQRIVAAIVNVGCDIAQQRIAAPDDIDAAVTLGLGYPKGPLAMGDAVGAAQVLAVLEGIQVVTGDPRYRPSLWLRRRALLGVPLTTAEG